MDDLVLATGTLDICNQTHMIETTVELPIDYVAGLPI